MTGEKRHFGRIIALLLIMLTLIGMVTTQTTHADDVIIEVRESAGSQEDTRLDEGAKPERGVDREAPLREAQIIEQTIERDGSIRTVLEIPATADSYIASNHPNNNYGRDALFLGYSIGGFGAERILLYFPLRANVPDNAQIESAIVQLYLFISDPADDSDMPSVIRRLGSSWNETTVTWNDAPQWLEVGDTVFIGDNEGLINWNITDFAKLWQQNLSQNHGVEIIGDEAVRQRERIFYARETQTNNFPRLRVTYTTDDGNVPLKAGVNPLPPYTRNPKFDVSWFNNGAAPLKHYDVRYRHNGGSWVGWQNQVTFNKDGFSAPFDGVYEYEARATDIFGNVEPWGVVEASIVVDAEAPFVENRMFLPVVRKNKR